MQFNFKEYQRIVDIGGGHNSFNLSTDVVDWRIEQCKEGKRYFELDVSSDRLPFNDGEIDFIYCRHTLEDLHNPFFALREMRRVGKRGYIETPHVITELRKETQSPLWRGYAHHFWYVWSVKNTIKLLPKSQAVGLVQLNDEELGKIQEKFPNTINHYFVWETPFEIERYINMIDFDYTKTYHEIIQKAIVESIEHQNTVVTYTNQSA